MHGPQEPLVVRDRSAAQDLSHHVPFRDHGADTPRDVHIASVVGGGLIGLVLMVVGALLFSASSTTGGTNVVVDLFEGATLFSVGAAFVIVSAIILPARRALELETTPHR